MATLLRFRPLFLSCLGLLPACSSALVTPPILGQVREVPVERGDPQDEGDPWRVGHLLAIPPSLHHDRHGPSGGLEASDRLTWDLSVSEPDGRNWMAECLASSYMSIGKGKVPGYREPTAVTCDVRRHGDEAFRLELTNAGSNKGIGALQDGSGRVTLDRADRPEDPGRVPDSFVVKHDGLAVGFLRTRPVPRLFVVKDLDPMRERAVERMALLTLALDAHAAKRFRGAALLPPNWARSDSPENVVMGSARAE
jgi:hypothetical protein